MLLTMTFVLAQVAGHLTSRVRIPGLTIIVPMFVTAGLSVGLNGLEVDARLRFLLLVLLGTAIGAQISRESLRALRQQLAGASIAAALMVLLGVGAALLLRLLDLAPHGDMLATSAGALSAVLAASVENDFDTPTIAVFHIVRITLVISSIPLLVALIRHHNGGPDNPPAEETTGASTPTEPIGYAATGGRVATRTERSVATLRFLVPAGAALLSAGLASSLGVRFPIVLMAFLGAASAVLLLPSFVGLSQDVGGFLQYSLAWLVGTMVTKETIAALGGIVLGATISTLFLIVGGLGVAILLSFTGLGPRGEVLATSPGALEVLTLMASEHGADPVEIGAYHMMRLIVVMLTLPLVLLITR
jgi:membrane AbrB-like protein